MTPKPHFSPPDAFQIEWLRLEFNRMIDGDDERLRVTGSKGRQVLDGLVEQLEAYERALRGIAESDDLTADNARELGGAAFGIAQRVARQVLGSNPASEHPAKCPCYECFRKRAPVPAKNPECDECNGTLLSRYGYGIPPDRCGTCYGDRSEAS